MSLTQIAKSGIEQLRAETTLLLTMMRRDAPTMILARTIAAGTVGLLLVFAVLTKLHTHSQLASDLYRALNVAWDDTVSESFMHGLSFLAAAMFLVSYASSRARILLFLAVLFLFIWFDDSAQYHENFGLLLSNRFAFEESLGLRPQDFGEILAWSLAAFTLAPLAIWAACRITPGDAGIAALIVPVFASLVFCGVLVDLFHEMTSSTHLGTISLIEDGGEMIAVSLATMTAVGLSRVVSPYKERLASAPRARSRVDVGANPAPAATALQPGAQ